jgi:hypothetical protein
VVEVGEPTALIPEAQANPELFAIALSKYHDAPIFLAQIILDLQTWNAM